MCGLNDSFVTAAEKQLKQGFRVRSYSPQTCQLLYTGNKKERRRSVSAICSNLKLGLIYAEPGSELDPERIKYGGIGRHMTESRGGFSPKEVLFTRVIVREEMSLSDTSLLLVMKDCAA